MTLDQLTERIIERLIVSRPRAYLIGKEPPLDCGFCYVAEAPYEAVVLGILHPGDLLQMPTNPVCTALLEDIPVYLWPEQPYKSAVHGKLLRRRLQQVECQLIQFGVQLLPGFSSLITAQDARLLKQLGKKPDQRCHLTPLAKEILEETV